MTVRFVLCVLALSVTSAATAQDVKDVDSTVVVADKVIENGIVPEAESGLTIAPVIESSAREIRRDAVELRKTGRFRNRSAIVQPARTYVDAKSIVVERKSKEAAACVQIGVIGTRPECRPPKR